MEYVFHLEDEEIDGFNSEKIIGYKTVKRLSRYKSYSIPPPPTPFLISNPEVFLYKNDGILVSELMKDLEDKIEREFLPLDIKIIALRVASKPLIDHAPNYKMDLLKQNWRANMREKVMGILEFSSTKKFSEMCFYVHPWAEPDDLRASADIYTSKKSDHGIFTVILTYGCGYGLEFGGDTFIVNVKNKEIEKRTIERKRIYYKVYDSRTGYLYDPPRGFPVPYELQEEQVLPDEEVLRIATSYAPLGRIFDSPVRLHWTRVRNKEEYTIDFQFIPSIPYPKHDILTFQSGRTWQVIELNSMEDKHKIKSDEDCLYVVRPSSPNLTTDELYSLIRSIHRGVIVSTGGLLSHPAIMAREQGIPYLHVHEKDIPKEGEKALIKKDGSIVVERR